MKIPMMFESKAADPGLFLRSLYSTGVLQRIAAATPAVPVRDRAA